MQKGTALATVKEDLSAWPKVAEACVAIIEHIGRTPQDALRRITFGSLAAAAASIDSQDIMSAIQYLAGARVSLLEPVYHFADHDGEDVPITATSVAEARATGQFFHPDTGQLVRDFERFIYVDFVLARQDGAVVAEWVGDSA